MVISGIILVSRGSQRSCLAGVTQFPQTLISAVGEGDANTEHQQQLLGRNQPHPSHLSTLSDF